MRFYVLYSLGLLIILGSSAYADEEAKAENGGPQQKPTTQRREFRVRFELSVEQQDQNGDVTFNGKTEPGRRVHRISSTLNLVDDELLTWPRPAGLSGPSERRSAQT